MADVIQVCIDSIRNDDVEELSLYLKLVPLENLSNEDTNLLLLKFLEAATSFNCVNTGRRVFEEWLRVYPPFSEERFPLLSTLFTSNLFLASTEILSFCVNSIFTDYTYIELMDDLIRYDASPTIPRACEVAIEIFGEQSPQTYVDLLDMARSTDNPAIANFLEEKVKENAEYADIPSWMTVGGEGEKSDDKELLVYALNLSSAIADEADENILLPSIDDMVSLLTNGLSEIGITIEDIAMSKKVLETKLRTATYNEKVELLRPVLNLQKSEKILNNDKIAKILGPFHPFVGSELSDLEKGRFNMFTCITFDYDADSNIVTPWFTGSCFQCLRKIRYYWYAVRLPVTTGGWTDCYCSWKCVRERISSPSFTSNSTGGALGSLLLVNKFEEEITRVGIQDRAPSLPITRDDDVDEDEEEVTEVTTAFSILEVLEPPIEEQENNTTITPTEGTRILEPTIN